MRKLNWFLLAVLVLSLWGACRKTDRVADEAPPENRTERFFNQHPPADPRVQAVARFVQGENEKKHFINGLTESVGFPRWNNSLVIAQQVPSTERTGDDDTAQIVFVPFVRDSQQYVNASLEVKMTPTDTSFRMLYDRHYSSFGFDTTSNASHWSALDVFLIFATLDQRIYGQRDYQVLDGRILGKSQLEQPVVHLEETPSGYYTKQEKSNLFTIISICYVITYPTMQAKTNGQGNSGRSQVSSGGILHCTLTYDEWGGDNSGGGTWNPDPSAGGGGGTGWVTSEYLAPYGKMGSNHFLAEDVSPEDATVIQNWIGNNLELGRLDSCRKKLIERIWTSVPGTTVMGRILTKMNRAIYRPNEMEKFKLSITPGKLAGANATTDTAKYNSTTGIFTCNITIDSVYMKTATDLALAATILHETIHAYMLSIFMRIKNGVTISQLQAMSYESLFNEYVDTLVAKNPFNLSLSGFGSNYHHNYMANHLLNKLAEAIEKFDNSAVADKQYYWYLAWGGLFKTQVWKYHWPNCFETPPLNWPPGNPSPSEDSTRGLKYALTSNRLQSILDANNAEQKAYPSAKGKKPIPGACY